MLVEGAKTLPHRRPPEPLHFPAEAEVPETFLHLLMRTLLFQVLSRHLGDGAAVGSEQFIYFNASDPKGCVAPDAFVKLAGDRSAFRVWNTWERGAPELAVEILSESDSDDGVWQAKLARYHAMGVQELVSFDMAAQKDRLRVWDRIEGDLVERTIERESSPCLTLGLHWVVRSASQLPVALRLARDPQGKEIIASPEERIAELEAQLQKLGQDAKK